jgi:hypothetical protein
MPCQLPYSTELGGGGIWDIKFIKFIYNALYLLNKVQRCWPRRMNVWWHICGIGAPRRWCTTEERRHCTIFTHPRTWHRFSSLTELPNCHSTVTIIQGFTNCKSEHTQSETKGRMSNILNMCPVIFSFQDTSLSSGTSYQMINPCVAQ